MLEMLTNMIKGYNIDLIETRRVNLHVNISPYASFEVIHHFLYHFLVFGVFWNQENGSIELPPPTAHWYVSLGFITQS